ncbi:MAG: AfsR/SARP family transcriptional regulator [Streptosporangiaceae bacterium]
MDREVALRVLGPVRLRAGEEWLTPGSGQVRLLAALLALRAGHVVPVEEMIDDIWDDQPPPSARASLQSLVTRLRRPLARAAGAALTRCGDGYRLDLDIDLIDLGRFRSLTRAARAADGEDAIALFDAALALWTGPALADTPDTARAQSIRQGLDAELMAATQDRLACMLACGQVHEASAELPAVLTRYPLNERVAGLFMASLYRSGLRAEALEVFQRMRRRLAADLGVEPGPELQHLHRAILAGDPGPNGNPGPSGARAAAAGPTQPPLAVPRQLPVVPEPFVGREAELDRLDAALRPAGDSGSAPVVWLLVGTAGVGKSALAARWAHRVADRFPDGQLYVDLKGFSPVGRPVSAERAVRGLLRALGVPSAQLPASLDAQTALYRSLLAGRRVLVLLDNVLDTEQALSLLPGASGCAVVVTSRVDLDGLVVAAGARVLCLDALSPDDSRELIARRIGATRALAEPEAVTRLVRSCGGLPLALAVVTARAAARPGLPLAALAAELSGPESLDAMETADRSRSVREMLSWSYRQLDQPAARMLRLLGLYPGPDISLRAAASLAGVRGNAARLALAELTRAHLVSERSPGRFGCEDLVHAYAAELAARAESPAERIRAVRRLVDHYLHTAVAAARFLYPAIDPVEHDPPEPGTLPSRIDGRTAALGWLTAEHQGLLATADLAVTAGLDTRAWRLTAAVTDYLDREGNWHDLASLGRLALAAAARSGSRVGQAHAHVALGRACLRFDEHQPAQSHLRTAVALFAACDAAAQQARCLVTLAQALAAQGRYAQARAEAERALRLYRELGHRAGEANALGDLGWHFAMLGRPDSAEECCRRAVDLHRELGNPLGEAYAWHHLGIARHQRGDEDGAAECYHSALDLLRVVGERPEQAAVLGHLADTYRATGSRDLARAAWQHAVAILDELRGPAGHTASGASTSLARVRIEK